MVGAKTYNEMTEAELLEVKANYEANIQISQNQIATYNSQINMLNSQIEIINNQISIINEYLKKAN